MEYKLRYGRLVILAIALFLISFSITLICESKEKPGKSDNSTDVVVFKPKTIKPDMDMILLGREIVIYRNIKDPYRACQLVDGKYHQTIQRVSSETGVPQDTLKALMIIESGGSTIVQSGKAAAGPMQMIRSTAERFDLKIDAAKSTRLRLLIEQAQDNPDEAWKVEEWTKELVRVDERYDPYKSIRAAAKYLVFLHDRYKRWDFAIAAYHAGEGNIDNLIRLYSSEVNRDLGHPVENIAKYGLSYPRIFFGCSPIRNTKTYYEWLWPFRGPQKDFSAWYYWNVQAAKQALNLWRRERTTFINKVVAWKEPSDQRRYRLEPEIVWYHADSHTYQDVGKLKDAYNRDELVRAPDQPLVFGYRLDPDEVGAAVDESSRPYFRGSRPETIGCLMYLSYLTRATSGRWKEPLVVTSLVRSEAYQTSLEALSILCTATDTPSTSQEGNISPTCSVEGFNMPLILCMRWDLSVMPKRVIMPYMWQSTLLRRRSSNRYTMMASAITTRC